MISTAKQSADKFTLLERSKKSKKNIKTGKGYPRKRERKKERKKKRKKIKIVTKIWQTLDIYEREMFSVRLAELV